MAFMPTSAFNSLYSGNLLSVNPMGTATLISTNNNNSGNGCKRKVIDPFDPEASVPLPFQLDDQFGTSVWKRNERERYRVRCVNEGYEKLRNHLPVSDAEKRISKVDTLRLAIRYIKHLNAILNNSQHIHNCRCFDGFKEESEGNVQVDMSVRSYVHNVYQMPVQRQ